MVARPHRILVDDGTEQSRRGNQMGHVVWRWKILSGECFLRPTLILLSGDFIYLFFFSPEIKQNSLPFIATTIHCIMRFLALFAQLIVIFQCKHTSRYSPDTFRLRIMNFFGHVWETAI